jgi:cytosine/uracil/thiamine/allantoin permease
MKNLLTLFLLLMMTALSGCSVIGDIFKAGVWVGVLAVVVVVGLIIYFISRASGKK